MHEILRFAQNDIRGRLPALGQSRRGLQRHGDTSSAAGAAKHLLSYFLTEIFQKEFGTHYMRVCAIFAT